MVEQKDIKGDVYSPKILLILIFKGKSGFVFNDCSSVYFISCKDLTVLFYIL